MQHLLTFLYLKVYVASWTRFVVGIMAELQYSAPALSRGWMLVSIDFTSHQLRWVQFQVVLLQVVNPISAAMIWVWDTGPGAAFNGNSCAKPGR